ncbi:MAG: hypothetical protein M1379_18370 [Firmicutes bacterium]|nr:hypothetical protein [Bacillota bacterium]
MNLEGIERNFREKVCDKVRLESEGIERFRVFTPFRFDDGDHLFVYALPGDDRTRDATITLLQFEKWGIPHHSIGIFENQENINRKVLARFSDICEKQFSNLGTNRERVTKYITEAL